LSASCIIYTRLLRAHVRRCVIGGTGALPLVARQCFPEPARYIPDRRGAPHRPADRPTGLTLPPRARSPPSSPPSRRRGSFSVFALIYAITTRDAFSSSHASAFVILCPAELRLCARAHAANCGNRVGSLARFSREIIVVSLASVRNVKSGGINQFVKY